MSSKIVESVTNSVPQSPQEATILVELTSSELLQIAGGIRAIGLITVDK